MAATDRSEIMELILRAPWHEAVTYRDTWPHEYVMANKDGQQELLAEFCRRITLGEGVECWFFRQKRKYLFLGDHKYWTMTDCPGIDLNVDDYVLNRALLYRDRRDFVIEPEHRHSRGVTMPRSDPGMKPVNVHKMWKDEAQDFTPWLAENLHVLNDVLGFKLELDQTEKPVGPFFCDILAMAGPDKVAIENQLEVTDHIHLGQLITYAAGLEVQVAVWIAPEILYEHAAALHWLNGQRSGPRFYGVKVMVLENDSGLEPRFCPVVTPDGWNEKITLLSKAADPHKLEFHNFFQPFLNALHKDFVGKPRQRFSYQDRQLPSNDNPGIWYSASLEGDDAWVTLHIETASRDVTKWVFDELERSKEDIEASIVLETGQEWSWRRESGFLFSSVNVRKDGSIDDETMAWMIGLLRKFKEVFEPRVKKILERSAEATVTNRNSGSGLASRDS